MLEHTEALLMQVIHTWEHPPDPYIFTHIGIHPHLQPWIPTCTHTSTHMYTHTYVHIHTDVLLTSWPGCVRKLAECEPVG